MELAGTVGDLSIPSKAVRQSHDEIFVYEVKGEHAEKALIDVIYDDGKRAIIRGSLSPSAQVIAAAPATLEAGDAVSIASNGGGKS